MHQKCLRGGNMAVGDKIIIDISLSSIEDTINTCNTIITSLNGSDGLGAFVEAHKMIESDLDGKYANALSNSVLEAKKSYLESLSNVTALKMVLKEYKKLIKNGSSGKLTSAQKDKIRIDMKQIYKQVTNLEEVIATESNLKKVLENGEGFDTWLSAYRETLDDTKLKSYELDENGNMTEAGFFAHWEDQKKERMFNANYSKLLSLNATLSGGLVATSSVVTKLEVISGVISGELSDLSAIWDAFELTKSDIEEYLIAHYELMDSNMMLNMDGSGASEQMKKEFEFALFEMMDGDTAAMTTFLNKIVSELDGSSEEGVITDLQGISSVLLEYLNIMIIFARYSNDKNMFGLSDQKLYDYYKKVYAVDYVLNGAVDYSLGKHNENISDINNDIFTSKDNNITSIEFNEEGVITIHGDGANSFNTLTGEEIDAKIYDTLMEKMTIQNLIDWQDALDAREKWISDQVMKGVVASITGGSEGLASIQKAVKSTTTFINEIKKPISLWKDVDETQMNTISSAFGLSMNGEGEYFIDAKGILVISEFNEQSNGLPTAEDFEKIEKADDWMKEPSGLLDPNDEDRKDYSNAALLDEISRSIETQFGMETIDE